MLINLCNFFSQSAQPCNALARFRYEMSWAEMPYLTRGQRARYFCHYSQWSIRLTLQIFLRRRHMTRDQFFSNLIPIENLDLLLSTNLIFYMSLSDLYHFDIASNTERTRRSTMGVHVTNCDKMNSRASFKTTCQLKSRKIQMDQVRVLFVMSSKILVMQP